MAKPNVSNIVTPKVIRTFLKYFEIGEIDECWPWLGGKSDNRHGKLTVDNISYVASRISYLYFNNMLTTSLLVLHKCNNDICVNPNHLYLGTNIDNKIDSMLINSQHKPKGELNGMHKLTEQEVLEIRESYTMGTPILHIARQYDMTHSMISFIVHRKNWKHI